MAYQRTFISGGTRRLLLLFISMEVAAIILWLPSILWPFTFTWDENTFYLVAARLLQGELPYTTTFENKSPLTLIPQALAMFVVGESSSALRTIAALLVGLSAFVASVIAPGPRRLLPAALTGFLMLLLWVTRTNGLVWMSEVNIVLVFLFALLLVLYVDPDRWWKLCLVGFFIGSIPLVRINWSFVALILFIFFVLKAKSWSATLLTGVASLLPLFLVILAYGFDGSLERLWSGAVGLPKSLGDGEGWRLPTLVDDQLPHYWLVLFAVINVLMITAIRLQRLQNESPAPLDWIVISVAWALTLGAWIQPYDFPYQTLQIVPLVALAVGRLFAAAPELRSATAIPVGAACLGLVFVLQTQVYTQFDWRNNAERERAVTAAVSELPGISDMTLWAPDDSNFLYWRLGKLPIFPLASMPYLVWDPGGQMAFRGEVLSEGDASQYVFDLEPDVIVARSDYIGSYNGTDEAQRVWRRNLEQMYLLITETHGHTVWMRKSRP